MCSSISHPKGPHVRSYRIDIGLARYVLSDKRTKDRGLLVRRMLFCYHARDALRFVDDALDPFHDALNPRMLPYAQRSPQGFQASPIVCIGTYRDNGKEHRNDYMAIGYVGGI